MTKRTGASGANTNTTANAAARVVAGVSAVDVDGGRIPILKLTMQKLAIGDCIRGCDEPR